MILTDFWDDEHFRLAPTRFGVGGEPLLSPFQIMETKSLRKVPYLAILNLDYFNIG